MPAYFDFTVSLQDVLPRPWRRFLIRRSASFAALHSAIQDACGWSDSHLYEFRATGDHSHVVIAGLLLDDPADHLDEPPPNAASARLTDYFGRGGFTTVLYVYDFGDGWAHDVQLNAVVHRTESFPRRLLGGEYAFPPDDSGGASGYEQIQKALLTGEDPEGLLEWASSVWGWTGAFNLTETQRRLERRRRR